MKITKEDIGRKVYCNINKEVGIIYGYRDREEKNYPVVVGFPLGNFETYTIDGKCAATKEKPNLSFDLSKQKKRYWKWLLKYNNWYKERDYLDEEGKNTEGYTEFFQWKDMTKKKIDNEWIEIDENGKIVATSYDEEE